MTTAEENKWSKAHGKDVFIPYVIYEVFFSPQTPK